MGAFAVGYERFCRAILTVFVINVAIIVHALLGLIVVGLFPAIASAYSVYRTWLLSDDRSWTVRETWKLFHAAWKTELKSANLLGWPIACVWLVVVYDYWLLTSNDTGTMGYAASGVLLLFIIGLGLFSLLVWAVRSNYAETNRWAVRMTAQMIIARPLCSITVAVLFFVTFCAWVQWPGIFMAFGISIPILLTMYAVALFGGLPGMGPDECGIRIGHAHGQDDDSTSR